MNTRQSHSPPSPHTPRTPRTHRAPRPAQTPPPGPGTPLRLPIPHPTPTLRLLPFRRPSPSASPSPSPLPLTAATEAGSPSSSTASDEEPIQLMQLSLDEDGDLIFVFDTQYNAYGLVLPLSDIFDLTWKETQGIVDAMRLCIPNKTISEASFAHSLKLLEHKYGMSKGPVTQEDGRICGAFYPIRGTIADNAGKNDGNMLVSTMLRIDTRDRRIVILAHTNNEVVYSIRIGLKGYQGKMERKECEAFIDVLTVLEPGDILDEVAFKQFFKFFCKRYGQHNCKMDTFQQDNLHIVNIDVFPAYQKRKPKNSKSPQIVNDINAPKVPQPTTPRHYAPSSPSTPSDSNASLPTIPMSPGCSSFLPECPYPGFTYNKLIADSGQAKVYEGVRDDDGLRVAIKVFHLDDDSTEAYKTELRLLLKMSAHENVVSVFDFFETPSPALVTKYIRGMELGDYIQQNGALTQKEGVQLAIGIAKGLFHLHHHGIVHRDLKSANVLVVERNNHLHPVIIDLGLSSVFPNADIINNSSQVTAKQMITKEVKGTPLWMAPEMILRHEWSDRTDIYAFGMILWELFSGMPPFVNDLPDKTTQMELLVQIAYGKRPSLQAINANVDKSIQHIITQCWNAKVNQRPSIKRVLDSLLGDDPKKIFEKYDLNGNGELEYHEFVFFLQFYAPERFSPMQTSALFETIDEDHSGEISYPEFDRFWRQVEIAGIESVINRRVIPRVISNDRGNPRLHEDQVEVQRRYQQQQQQHDQEYLQQQQEHQFQRHGPSTRSRPYASLLREL